MLRAGGGSRPSSLPLGYDLTPSRVMQLEEGEVDTERGRLFGFCYRRVYRQEMEERRERVRKENAEQRARLTGGGMRS